MSAAASGYDAAPMDAMMRALGQALKEAREDGGHAQRPISIASGVTESNLGRFERGQLKEPPDKLAQILYGYVEVTGVPYLELWRRAFERVTASQAAEAMSAMRASLAAPPQPTRQGRPQRTD